MKKVTINEQKYLIPTSWKDITVSKWRQWITMDGEMFERLSVATDIPVDVLEQCDVNSVNALRTMTDFLYHPELLEAYNIVDKRFEGFQVGQQKAKTILQVQGALLKAKKALPGEQEDSLILYLYAGPEIVEVYYEALTGEGIDISDDSIVQWYGLMCFFLGRWVHFSINTISSTIIRRLKMRSKQASPRLGNFRRMWGFASRLWRGSASRSSIS